MHEDWSRISGVCVELVLYKNYVQMLLIFSNVLLQLLQYLWVVEIFETIHNREELLVFNYFLVQ